MYHHLMPGESDYFQLMVAESSDLKDWSAGRTVLTHASMGQFYFAFGGVLLAFEENPEGVGPCVAFTFYQSVDALLQGNHSAHFRAPRSLSTAAEGTPNILNIQGEQLESSIISVGLHFFDGDRDLQGLGALTNFKSWRAEPSNLVNQWLTENGLHGKLGSRATFSWKNRRWWVMEAQKDLSRGWDTWTLLLGDGLGFTEVAVVTPKGGASFANPFVAAGQTAGDLIVSLFVPSETHSPGEIGELIYSFHTDEGLAVLA